ncbi:MAG: ABC transporter substrate-binding protein [Streptosporangiaceae bacterium]
MRQPRLLGIVLTASAIVASACGSSASSAAGASQKLAPGGTMTIGIPADPGNLDPQKTVLSVDNQAAQLAYDPLVQASASGGLVSGLASTWQLSGNSVTFTLKKGVTCADGSPVTPALVAANVAFIANPKNTSPLLGVALPPGTTAIAGTGPDTVTLSWPKPFPFVLQSMTGMPIVCPKGLANRGTLAHGTEGTGPYVLTQAVPGTQYTYAVRRGYTWGPAGAATSAAGMPAKVVLKVITNESTAANLLLAGQVNVAGVIGPDRTRLAAAHLFSRSELTNLGEMEFNEAPGRPAADENVRRALTMALDLSQLKKVMTSGNGAAPTGLVSLTPKPCQANTVQGNVPGHDLAAAQQLLTQAGWTPGPGGVRVRDGKKLTLSFLVPSSEGTPVSDAAQLAVSEWQKLGVQVTTQSITDTQLSAVLFGTGAWDVGWVPFTIQLPSTIMPFLSGPPPPAGTNFGHIANTAYTQLATAAAALPGTTGCQDWNKAEEALFTNADLVLFAAQTVPVWASHATFQLNASGPIPTSLRLTSH